ncbi:hypothetical protein FGO68_gene9828 [Halteria grandinella]|uniref:Uncharacterized protein n=1 Tax=Halteria grandinella TaxID=5974 RepID=A0A8J8NEF1_HALGN|nr:hypothetical protein FGO68_gene9828 [Halteria grandinella]
MPRDMITLILQKPGMTEGARYGVAAIDKPANTKPITVGAFLPMVSKIRPRISVRAITNISAIAPASPATVPTWFFGTLQYSGLCKMYTRNYMMNWIIKKIMKTMIKQATM